MTKYLFLFLLSFLWIVFSASAQKKTEFPASWQGNWNGELKIHKADKAVQSVSMSLEIKQLDSVRYAFAIVYGPDREKGLRPYELIVKNAATGEYVIDEKNSIRMEAYLFGEKLVCSFSVGGTRLLSSYEKNGENIVFEVISGPDKAVSTTGGQKTANGEIPAVQAFPVAVMQRAVLRRR
ncbi:MAG: hypothetical protein MUD08_08775 [Cytophagales bacterium]|jgi:hypothetical protein|nr:hypothetical protein [Cytophagales bacterium]